MHNVIIHMKKKTGGIVKRVFFFVQKTKRTCYSSANEKKKNVALPAPKIAHIGDSVFSQTQTHTVYLYICGSPERLQHRSQVVLQLLRLQPAELRVCVSELPQQGRPLVHHVRPMRTLHVQVHDRLQTQQQNKPANKRTNKQTNSGEEGQGALRSSKMVAHGRISRS